MCDCSRRPASGYARADTWRNQCCWRGPNRTLSSSDVRGTRWAENPRHMCRCFAETTQHMRPPSSATACHIWQFHCTIIAKIVAAMMLRCGCLEQQLRWLAASGRLLYRNQKHHELLIIRFYCCTCGATENAELDIARPSKLWGLTVTSRDWTTRHHIARVDIAEHDNAAPCRSNIGV